MRDILTMITRKNGFLVPIGFLFLLVHKPDLDDTKPPNDTQQKEGSSSFFFNAQVRCYQGEQKEGLAGKF